MGAGPSFNSPAASLNAWGFVKAVDTPLVWGMREDSRPVLSS